MKIKLQCLLGSVLAFSFFACSNESPNVKRAKEVKEIVEPEEKQPELIKFGSDTTYEFKIAKPSQDTFKLVSSSWFFWYPFGNFTSPEELKHHFKDKFKIVEETEPLDGDPTGRAELFRVKLNNGYIKYFFTAWYDDTVKNDMLIVYAKIIDPTIQMTNGLKVGLTRDEVKKILFSKGEPKNLRNFDNLTIATGLQGVWVHLNFENEILKKIIIDSDYLLKKE